MVKQYYNKNNNINKDDRKLCIQKKKKIGSRRETMTYYRKQKL